MGREKLTPASAAKKDLPPGLALLLCASAALLAAAAAATATAPNPDFIYCPNLVIFVLPPPLCIY
jgi:uncharacterized RDD family membrane protein YckC